MIINIEFEGNPVFREESFAVEFDQDIEIVYWEKDECVRNEEFGRRKTGRKCLKVNQGSK